MLKSCGYCGRIHDSKYDCGKKPQYKKQHNDIVKFRNTKQWRVKREEIKERDLYLCQVCRYCNEPPIFNSEYLEVHHIIPLVDDFNRRLDNDILITLCRKDHELAESGEIDKKTLLDIVSRQNKLSD